MTLRTSRRRPRTFLARHRRRVEYAAVVAVMLLVANVLFVAESHTQVLRGGELRVWFFDVGQGDATFIETPDGHQILIDAGRDDAVLAKLGSVMPPWDRAIDVVVATHPDADHVGGLASVLERYDVARVVSNGDEKDTDVAAAFLEARDAEPGAVLEIGRKGSALVFGDVTLTELWPTEASIVDEDANVASIVYLLSYGDTTVLLTGDATESVEFDILRSVGDLDVLKAGHHGSRTSSAYEFIRATTPVVAIISSGENNTYGHPHPAILKRFADLGVGVFRTDEDGDVLLVSDGGEPFVGPAPLPF